MLENQLEEKDYHTHHVGGLFMISILPFLVSMGHDNILNWKQFLVKAKYFQGSRGILPELEYQLFGLIDKSFFSQNEVWELDGGQLSIELHRAPPYIYNDDFTELSYSAESYFHIYNNDIPFVIKLSIMKKKYSFSEFGDGIFVPSKLSSLGAYIEPE